MYMEFNRDLTRQDVYANGAELANIMGRDRDRAGNRVYTYPKNEKMHVVSFDKPILVTDNYKIGKLPAALRDTVFALFASPQRITHYDGTTLEFYASKYNGVWGPSIDTLLFCRALAHKDLTQVRTAIELGSGSGFIAKYVLEHAPHIEEITFIDLIDKAERCAKDNIDDKRAKIITGDAIEYLAKEKQKFDLIICNPPYIPRPRSIDDNPYEGISLLTYIINQHAEILSPQGSIITNISSMCEQAVMQTINQAKVDVRQLDQMRVPLKVYNVLNNKEWMDFLIKEKGLSVDSHDGYDYWQQIAIVELSQRKSEQISSVIPFS
jgi:release factor glutamine methyltransferase